MKEEKRPSRVGDVVTVVPVEGVHNLLTHAWDGRQYIGIQYFWEENGKDVTSDIFCIPMNQVATVIEKMKEILAMSKAPNRDSN